ncbi:MAG: glutamine synthetase family protein [Alphaproteobacteria bacterium]|nr:glutamine synthetase family protein [Alphaproteobacteria bacterium]
MDGDDLVMFLCPDLSGLSRGRAFPAADLAERLKTGVGWVPADQALTPFDEIAEPNPWGPIGDLRLMPDPATEVRVELWEEASPLHFFVCDCTHTDGSPWDACARTFLKGALADLEAEGFHLRAAFEHEFHVAGLEAKPGPGFSFEALRAVEPLGPLVMAALREAGAEPEMFLPEYGNAQYEVVCRPARGLAAADRAVIIREVVREAARGLGLRASFSPLVDPAGVGNGVHIHMSLEDREGRPLSYDGARPGGLSELAAGFAAGILRHLPALVALTAPSVISYLRLVPHNWSAAFTCLGLRNREAALRIAPVLEMAGADPARQYNLEYRPADAAASPHLALGAVVRAGLAGIREGLEPPPIIEQDPVELSDDERRRLGVVRLPETLAAALEALEADAVVRSWFSDDLWNCYLSLKRTEMGILEGLEAEAMCARYLEVY